jgi:hypothetical protein
MTKLGRPTSGRKNKVMQIRCTQEFLDEVDSLCAAFGMDSRTELIEYLVDFIPALAAQKGECLDE